MSSENFVDALNMGKNLEAEDAFKSAMQDKIGAALETKRREVANSFVKTPTISIGVSQTRRASPNSLCSTIHVKRTTA